MQGVWGHSPPDAIEFLNRHLPGFLKLLSCGHGYACLCACVSVPRLLKTIHVK